MTEEERNNLRSKYNISEKAERPYVMGEERDYGILSKVKELESKELSVKNRETVQLIRSQLIDDWRKPLIAKLNEILRNYVRT